MSRRAGDLILCNGEIVTNDEPFRFAQAPAIERDRFVVAGKFSWKKAGA